MLVSDSVWCGLRSEYGSFGAVGGRHVVRVYVGDVCWRGAQARAQACRRVRRQSLLHVLQRGLERAHDAQLQPTQGPVPTLADAALLATDRPDTPPYAFIRVWCGLSRKLAVFRVYLSVGLHGD